MSDIEISQKAKKLDIRDVAAKLNLKEDDIILYGNSKAKIKKSLYNDNSKLILVTAISPTPYGEGKTTVSIGLNDALCKLDKRSVAVLREPSMGPVFGMKGGATGGGYSQVVPMEEINLHFTGDFHAIESANNLLSAAIYNHIYQGNELDIQKVLFNRCMDVNDRALRVVTLGNGEEKFNITAASEIMALFCLANSLEDLKKRLGNIVVGLNSNNDFVYASDLKVEGAMAVLLKDAFLPNLVQTLENNPVIIHGGPFANIAHGCNSVVATKLGLGLADYVVTEAGFGADLGAEKFYDIKCRSAKLKPTCTVLVATIKALKYHGGVRNEFIYEENNEALVRGLANLEKHFTNLQKFGKNIIVCLNRYGTDKDSEISLVKRFCQERNMAMEVSSAYSDGSDGALSLAKLVLDYCNDNQFKLLYDDNLKIVEKIDKVCKEIYGASKVNYSNEAQEKIKLIEKNKLDYLPICVAKTQYSLSDDAKRIGVPTDFEVTVKDLSLYNGAGIITVLLGNIMTMPGLPRRANFENIDLVDGVIKGIN